MIFRLVRDYFKEIKRIIFEILGVNKGDIDNVGSDIIRVIIFLDER